MLKVICFVLFSSFFSHSAQAFNLIPDGINLTYGKYLPIVTGRTAKYDNFRLGLNWHIDESLYQKGNFAVDSYFELAGSLWQNRLQTDTLSASHIKDRSWVASFSPVLRLTSATPLWGSVSPLLDAGAGIAWLSDPDLKQEHPSGINMGGRWAFELRLMAGFSFGERQQYDIRYGWFHYSNANINTLNESMDFHTITLGWRW